jgi:hypothetical protein
LEEVVMARVTADPSNYAEAQMVAFGGEHVMGYVAALGAFLLATLGVLEGFGIIDWVSAGQGVTVGTTAAAGGNDFQDGLLYLVPAGTAAFLSFYFHMADHHRMGIEYRWGRQGTPGTRTKQDEEAVYTADAGMWVMEHGFAMLCAGAAVVLAAIGMLIGFGAFGDYTFEDAMLWEIASLIPAIVSCSAHLVGHHTMPTSMDR